METDESVEMQLVSSEALEELMRTESYWSPSATAYVKAIKDLGLIVDGDHWRCCFDVRVTLLMEVLELEYCDIQQLMKWCNLYREHSKDDDRFEDVGPKRRLFL